MPTLGIIDASIILHSLIALLHCIKNGRFLIRGPAVYNNKCQGTVISNLSMPMDWYLTYLITQALFDKFLIGKFCGFRKTMYLCIQ